MTNKEKFLKLVDHSDPNSTSLKNKERIKNRESIRKQQQNQLKQLTMYSKFYVIKHPKLGYLRTKYWRPLQWTDFIEDAKKWNRKSDATQSINKSVRFSDYFDESHVEEIQYIVTNIVSPIKND